MWWRVYLGVALLAEVGCGWAQAAEGMIENPKNLPVNPEQFSLLDTMICQEMAGAYHIGDYKKLEFPLTAVLREEHERYTIDHSIGTATIYLQKWDETSFASAATMLAFHRVLSIEQFLSWR